MYINRHCLYYIYLLAIHALIWYYIRICCLLLSTFNLKGIWYLKYRAFKNFLFCIFSLTKKAAIPYFTCEIIAPICHLLVIVSYVINPIIKSHFSTIVYISCGHACNLCGQLVSPQWCYWAFWKMLELLKWLVVSNRNDWVMSLRCLIAKLSTIVTACNEWHHKQNGFWCVFCC